ncbi:MAG: TIGR01212 family radical SAM protein, partial [Desulfovibrionaceae bacterium]
MDPAPRHHSLAAHLKRRFGAPVRKIPLDAGADCPNRDGTIGRSGCLFCNPHGSGSGLLARGLGLPEQWDHWRARLARHGADRYLAYLQSFTNTHGPAARLAAVLDQLRGLPGLAGLCVGTRPDCCEDDKLDLLAAFRDALPPAPDGAPAPVILELGLQSADDAVLARIRRGHDAACFAHAARRAAARGLEVCAHVVAGLPGAADRGADLRNSVALLNTLPVAHVKFHNCYVCEGSGLAAEWRAGRYAPPALPDYAAWLAEALADLRPGVVVHRLVADPAPGELLAPDWAGRKAEALAAVRRELETRRLWQGCRAFRP